MGDIKRLAGEQFPGLGDLSAVAGVIDEVYAPDSTQVQSSHKLALLPPVSGGEGDPAQEDSDFCAGVFELSAAALDVQALEQRVLSPRCGALVTFVGTTRDTHQGEKVQRLEYEAFEAMTGPEMGRIFADCLDQLGASGRLAHRASSHRPRPAEPLRRNVGARAVGVRRPPADTSLRAAVRARRRPGAAVALAD